MLDQFVGAIDCGTTSARFFIFDRFANVIASHQEEYPQHYPHPGWHEQDPQDWIRAIDSCISSSVDSFKRLGHQISQLKTIGITNQRETTVVWEKSTGRTLHRAIAWPDTRTTSLVHQLSLKTTKFGQGAEQLKSETGLPLSNYFTAVKFRWLVDNVEEVKAAYESEDLLVGTVDTYLLWHYTGGISGGAYLTDITNASRTMWMDLKTLKWSADLVSFFGFDPKKLIPLLPKIVSNSQNLGYLSSSHYTLPGVMISGLVGDQQSSLVGNQCLSRGESKSTYGTGCFMLYNTGHEPVWSTHGLITTPGYQLGSSSPPVYALEGSVAVAGSSVQWLKNNLGLISSSSEVNRLAAEVEDTGGVYFVTAFSGLFAPYWNDSATGLLIGLTAFTTKSHIARATLEATCFQTKAILDAMELDQSQDLKPVNSPSSSSDCSSDMPITPLINQRPHTHQKSRFKPAQSMLKSLKVDGGMSASDVMLQFQADILGVNVERAEMAEATALGAALLAGHAINLFGWDLHEPRTLKEVNLSGKRIFTSQIDQAQRSKRYKGWNRAVKRSKKWFVSEEEEEDDLEQEEHETVKVDNRVNILSKVIETDEEADQIYSEEAEDAFYRVDREQVILDSQVKRKTGLLKHLDSSKVVSMKK
ncbi:glycerol kinase [Phakopsora pachyrhizi]|uniref:glycerol kinase n=1 Tax=Phakopsora pachyrhizi TaxID=170000 RepID=A0AAV0B4M6_PHAPC|nr:glycerol kinase [Phakopsora pachyrhizi]